LDEKDLPPPMYLQPPGKDLKLHLKFKQIGDDVRKSIMVQKSVWGSFLESAVNVIGNELDANAAAKKLKGGPQDLQDALKFPLGGKNSRVDYSLQPGIIDNEYIR
jgi:hypothetical protein